MEGMEYWLKQTPDAPLFEDILWSRPENRMHAGKLLVIGGNAHGFSAPGEAFAAAEKAGAGTVRTLLPDALKKTLGLLGPYEFAPSSPSGGFGRDALNEFLIQSAWADGVLLAGDLGRNSETAILFESYVQKYNGLLTLANDATDYATNQPDCLSDRENTCIVLSTAQLQRLGTALKFATPFLLDMGLMLLVQALHDFTEQHPFIIVTKEQDNLVVTHQGRVSTTKVSSPSSNWQTSVAAKAAVFWLQSPTKTFESVSAALI